MEKWVSRWLFLGVVLILIQIFIGGVTRLTGSGLSITKWEIIVGTIPPLSEDAWMSEFDLYKQTPQYEKINQGMSLSEFKFIYFWEYFHRLWARFMGLVFLIPFLFFYKKDLISSSLLRRLFIVFLLASTVAVFGWVMVASGLVERPWVNAYKLSMHLGLAMVLILYLFDTWLYSKGSVFPQIYSKGSMLFLLTALVFLLPIQILAGGIISGMRAALIFPTWPKIGTEWIPSILFQSDNWNSGHFMMYDKDLFMPTLIHLIHRSMGYIISILVILYAVVSFRNKLFSGSQIFILLLVLAQVLLGVYVLINSVGEIPLWLGVAHQLLAFILLLFVYYLYKFSKVI